MNEFEKIINSMDFSFFATGKHKIDAATFFASRDTILLDVRAKEETSTIKLSLTHHSPVIEIPFNDLPLNIDRLPKNKFIGVFCSSGVRSAITFAYLKTKGFENVKMIEGGYLQLMDAIMPGKIYKHIKK
jgi:rhodanese-related sulfurtransferase